MSKDWYQDIVDFHREVMEETFKTTPHQPSFKYWSLRYTLVEEEIKETLSALAEGNLEELADGICDSIVVLLGTAVTYGIDIRPIWNEIHRTNMLKVGGELRSDGKRLKPEGWQPPKVKELLVQQGAEL